MRSYHVLAATALAAASLAPAARPARAAVAPAPPMRWVPAHSSNYSRRSARRPNLIVIHTIEGSEGGGISWFQNPAADVSAHYVVSRTGRVTRMVRDHDVAWHVVGYNERSIGIENEGYASRNGWTDAQYRRLIELVRHLCEKHGIPKDRAHVRGHDELNPWNRSDPGRHFDWNRLMRGIRDGGGSTAPGAPPPARGLEVTTPRLHVRAGVWGRVLGQVSQGDRFVRTGKRSGGFTQIWWAGRRAWVWSDYTRNVAAAGIHVKVDEAVVRAGAGGATKKVGKVRRGQRYIRLGGQGDWKLFQFGDRRRWIHERWVKLITVRR